MLNIIANGKSSMNAQQKKLDIISNNIANVGTNGYKKNNIDFQDLLSDTYKRRGTPINEAREGDGIYTQGTGVRVTDIKKDFSQGMLQESGRKTDFAIDGDGFFQVTLADGTLGYTRDGNFNIDGLGNLTDSNGNRVTIVDESGKNVNTFGGEADFSDGIIRTDLEGRVFIQKNNQESFVGQLAIKDFDGDKALMSVGNNIFIPKDNAEAVDARGYKVLNGFIETSNVRLEDEMADMIVTQRAFQVNSTSIKTADQMWGLVNDLFR